MAGILDELLSEKEKAKDILKALKNMAKALTLPIEMLAGISPENTSGTFGLGAFLFSQAAMACFEKFGFQDKNRIILSNPIVVEGIKEVDKLIEEFGKDRNLQDLSGLKFFFYGELGNIMLGKAKKYSPALWTTFEPGLLNEFVDWV